MTKASNKKAARKKSWAEVNPKEAEQYKGYHVLVHPLFGIVMFAKNPLTLEAKAKALLKKDVKKACVRLFCNA